MLAGPSLCPAPALMVGMTAQSCVMALGYIFCRLQAQIMQPEQHGRATEHVYTKLAYAQVYMRSAQYLRTLLEWHTRGAASRVREHACKHAGY